MEASQKGENMVQEVSVSSPVIFWAGKTSSNDGQFDKSDDHSLADSISKYHEGARCQSHLVSPHHVIWLVAKSLRLPADIPHND